MEEHNNLSDNAIFESAFGETKTIKSVITFLSYIKKYSSQMRRILVNFCLEDIRTQTIHCFLQLEEARIEICCMI